MRFAIIGTGGYIAPRHLQAIKDTGHELVAAFDPNDSVGILDSYFPDVEFFNNFENFNHFVEHLPEDKKIDYVSICSPNHLHRSHISFALSKGAHAICEKPLGLTCEELDYLNSLEKQHGKKVNTILQLRVHDSIIKLKEEIDKADPDKKHIIELGYFTSRGPWYHRSWKGDLSKSGGLATNIGIHFFDMITWIFGAAKKNEVHVSNESLVAGYLELEKAEVSWVLSIDRKHLPEKAKLEGKSTYRSITIDGKEIEFSGGFTDLHTKVYEDIIAGKGFGPDDARTAVKIVEDIRNNLEPVGQNERSHPLLKEI